MKLRKPKLSLDGWCDDIPEPYRHCTTCQHHKSKDYPFGLCKRKEHQVDDERCEEYQRKITDTADSTESIIGQSNSIIHHHLRSCAMLV
jgi:hypothetical protein